MDTMTVHAHVTWGGYGQIRGGEGRKRVMIRTITVQMLETSTVSPRSTSCAHS